MNFTLAIHEFHAIINGILKQRLKYQFYNTAIPNLFIYLKIHFKTVLISYLLNVHIILCMLYFIFDPDDRFSLT